MAQRRNQVNNHRSSGASNNTQNLRRVETTVRGGMPNQENRQPNGERRRANNVNEEAEALLAEMVAILLVHLIACIILAVIVFVINSTNILKVGQRMLDILKPLISITLGGELFRVSYVTYTIIINHGVI